MKKSIILLLMLPLLLLINVKSYSHKEWVHQHIVKEAYIFLENEVDEIPELKNYLGINQFGPKDPNGLDWGSFNAITIGAWDEDHTDILWLYGSNWYSLRAIDPSCTHFWVADLGDGQTNSIPLCGSAMPNAFTKAKHLMFGTKYDQNFCICPHYRTTIVEGGTKYINVFPFLQYRDLCDFLTTKQFRYKKVYDLNGRRKVFDNSIWRTMSNKTFPYNILGRISHLLADMSVPAHVLPTFHPCKFLMGDAYELWIASNDVGDCNQPHTSFRANGKDGAGKYGEGWNALTAREQGGLLYEVFSLPNETAFQYLFYTLNQLSEHFPSFLETGYKKYGNNNLVTYSDPLIQGFYNLLGEPPIDDPEFILTSDVVLNYCIRATATLFYLILINAGIVECPNELYIQNTMFYGNREPYDIRIISSRNIFAGKEVRNDLPVGNVINVNGSITEYVASNEIVLKDGFIIEAGAESILKINNELCQLEENFCFEANNNFPKMIIHNDKIQGNPILLNFDIEDYDSLKSLSLYFWEDSKFLGDSITYLICDKLFMCTSNPPWSDELSDELAALSYFIVDTVRFYLLDTLYQDISFQFELIGDYSVEFLHDTAIVNLNIQPILAPISSNDNLDILISPNPSEFKINFDVELKEDTEITIIIFDIHGNIIETLAKNIHKNKGLHNFEYNLNKMSQGNYTVVVYDKKKMISKRFIKIN